MKIIFHLLAITLAICSCKKEDSPTVNDTTAFNEINYPNEIDSIDIDGNGTIDFYTKFTFTSTFDIPVSYANVSGEIFPTGENTLLFETTKPTLYLTIGDSIKINTNKSWTKYNLPLLNKSWNGEEWEAHWQINAVEDSPFVLGFHLQNDGTNKLGQIKFDFNIETGEIIIVSHTETTSDYLIVE